MTSKNVATTGNQTQLLKRAKAQYIEQQAGWLEWTKTLYTIRESAAFLEAGYDHFTEYCGHEFPVVGKSIISRSLSVYERFKEQLDAVENIKSSYDGLYRLVGVEEHFEKKKFQQLASGLMDGSVKPVEIRREIEEIKIVNADNERERLNEEGRQIDRMVEEYCEDSEEIDVESPRDYADDIIQIESRIEYLIDNVPGIALAALYRADSKKSHALGKRIEACIEVLQIAAETS